MIIEFSILIMLFQYCSTLDIDLDIFDMRNGYKHLIDEMKAIKPSSDEKILTKWIDQPFDHFDKNENRKWSMRYFEDTQYWKAGPVYLFLGGESPASKYFLKTGIMYELAKETKGAMYMSEHRYYGKSKPLNGTSAKDFQYLTARQALADVANLLGSIKSLPQFSQSKVVVIGGSYSGNLAAWMRELYPDLVDAAIASSGPVLAKKDFYEYLEKVHSNYELYGDDGCLDRIRNIFRRYEKLLETPEGINILKKEENICENCNMSVPVNKQVFFISKTSYYMYTSQYGTSDDIKKHCTRLNDTQVSKRNFWNARQNCYDYSFDSMIQEYYEAENDWILAWTYQTCDEFGYFQTTTSESQPFTKNVPLDLYIKICKELFGEQFDEKRVDKGVTEVNKLYGGLELNVSKVVFTNGDMDPWSTLGILEDISYEAPAVVIARASHCRDLISNRDGDHEELKEARNHVKYLIKRWINAFPYV